MNHDGENVINLTWSLPKLAYTDNASWSPNGQKVVFNYSDENRYQEIYIANSDGSNVEKLTTNAYSLSEWNVSWSPNSPNIQPISIVSIYKHQGQVYTFNTSESFDPEDKHDLEYRLDFGSGMFTQWSRTKTYTQSFSPGRYNIVLEVRDSGGLTDRVTKELVVNPRLAGDFNGDGIVDFSDFFQFADYFGSSNAAYDLNADGVVDFTDFFLFADNFGQEARAKLMDLAHQYLGLPREFSLAHNYPNPFNNETAINYALPTDSPVLLEIYNIKGQKVRTLQQGYMPAGAYTAKWDGRDNYGNAVGSGVYFYQLNAGSFSKANKMVMVK